MLRNVFTKTLRDQRKSFMFWAIGVAVLSLLTVLFYPSISEAEELNDIFSDAEALNRVFAGGVEDFTSPEGFLTSQLYALLAPILFLVFVIGQGSGAIAGEEERGSLDILLAYPTTRLQVLVQKFAAMAVATSALGFVMWVSVVVGAAIVSMELSIWRVAEITLSGTLLGIVFGAFALTLGSAFGKRGLSIGVTGAVAITAYFIYALMPLVEGLEPLEKVSPFFYYMAADPLTNGLDPVHAAVLIALSVVLVVIALVTFERRDLAV